jgi:hypothetical protein
VVLWIPDFPDVGLLGGQLLLVWNQSLKKSSFGVLIYSASKLALG